MKLFLAAVQRTTADAVADVARMDDVALFDCGVWSSAGPSEAAVRHVTASDVAWQVYSQAALTQLADSAHGEPVVCFRYGPRPPPQLDIFLFHRRPRRDVPAADGPVPAPPAPPHTSVSSTSLPFAARSRSSSSSSSNSIGTGSSPAAIPLLPPPPHKRTTAPGAGVDGDLMYDSVLALWLSELLGGDANRVVTVAALCLSADGVAVDLLGKDAAYTTVSVHSGATVRLSSNADAVAVLSTCEAALQRRAAEALRCPHHVCITVRVGVEGATGPTSTVTFLDVACAAADTVSVPVQVRLREQLATFHHLLRAESSPSASLARPLAHCAADLPWLRLLQSCRLSSAPLVGLLHVTHRAGSATFEDVDVAEDGCDPLLLADALRHRAVAEAVDSGTMGAPSLVSHPTRPVRRSSAQPLPRLAPDPPTHRRTSASGAPPYRRTSAGGAPPHRRGGGRQRRPMAFSVHRSRSAAVRRLGRLAAEEHHTRRTLERAEQRARELTEMRWMLCARPPGKSIGAAVRRIAHGAGAQRSPATQQRQRRPPHRSPPPPREDHLTTTRVSSSSDSSATQHFGAATWSPSSAVPAMLPQLASTPIAASGSAARPLDDVRAASLQPRCASARVHRDSPHADTQRRPSRRRSLSPMGDSPYAHTYSSPRRYSALEVALLARAQSASLRASPAESPGAGEVERLYPLIHAFHAEVNRQDALMAEELMMRSHIEHREMNRRKALRAARATAAAAAAAAATPSASPVMKRRSLRVFFH
ncbi:hypothetical protein NESM_000203700 [Novymonas esmeraldas]|uniref:Uncharacterized protein n=1 Tax=Novymonas esmeraldas TaxID=1808958 RepID=A0AAW0F6N3_9TRYP